MMASLMSYFVRKDPKQVAREAIIGLREQQQMMEKKAGHFEKQIEQLKEKAKANAVKDKKGMLPSLHA